MTIKTFLFLKNGIGGVMRSQEKENWLRERKSYIGGSDIASICGLNKYKSAMGIYLEKTSSNIEETPTSGAIEWGTLLEDTIANAYSIKTGFTIEVEPNVIRHPEHSFIAANIDRWANGKKHILECKTAGYMMSKEWGQEYTDQIPENYLCQVAYYAAICDVEKVDIAVLIGGQNFRIYTYNRNRDFESKLIKVAYNFWHNNVLKGIPPEATSTDDILALYPKAQEFMLEADNEIVDKVMKLQELKNEEKNICNAARSLQFEIQNFMKDADILVDHSGNCLATWKNSSPRVALDVKRLQEEHNDIYLQYAKEKEGTRMFLIK
jgi:putative phage-type endonuclease